MFETFTKGGISNKDNSSIIHLPKIFNCQPYKNVGFDQVSHFLFVYKECLSDLNKEAIKKGTLRINI